MFQSKGLQEEYALIAMEGYVAEDCKRALDVCLDDVAAADIYILILAKRYGSLIDGTNKSYTEAEYDQARQTKLKKPGYKIFVFYSGEETEKVDFANLQGLENENLLQFYQKALGENACFISPFTNPDNLCKQILITFAHNFKPLKNLNDYTETLLILDRTEQSYSFSKLVKNKTNAFYFTAFDDNSPNDFFDRLHKFEMGSEYRRCKIGLDQFYTNDYEKFRGIFTAERAAQWQLEIDEKNFVANPNEKLLLGIEISSEEIVNTQKIENLQKTLEDFLPKYLLEGESTTANRILVIFYNTIDKNDQTNIAFKNLVQALNNSVKIPCCFNEISPLNDLSKSDAKNWLDTYIKFRSFDEDDLDEILEIEACAEKYFTMKSIKKSLKNWLKQNIAS